MSLLTRRVSRQALSHSCTTLTASNQLLFKWFDKTSIVKVFSFTTFLKLWMYLKFKTQTLTNMSWIRMRMIPHLPHVFEIFTSLQIFAALVKLNRWNMLFCYIFLYFLVLLLNIKILRPTSTSVTINSFTPAFFQAPIIPPEQGFRRIGSRNLFKTWNLVPQEHVYIIESHAKANRFKWSFRI